MLHVHVCTGMSVALSTVVHLQCIIKTMCTVQYICNFDYPDTLVPEAARISEWINHASIHPLNVNSSANLGHVVVCAEDKQAW